MYEDRDVRRARSRAVRLRGIVRQLAGRHGDVVDLTLTRSEPGAAEDPGGGACELRYRVATMRYERRVVMTCIEASCLTYLASRAGVALLVLAEGDRARVDAALQDLALGLRLSLVEAPSK